MKQRAKNPSGSHPENKSDVTVRNNIFIPSFIISSFKKSLIKRVALSQNRTRDVRFNNILGCKPPAGSVLSDCTSKGKKYTICTAKCANGNEGEWRTRCSKKKGKYIWDSIAAKVEAACNWAIWLAVVKRPIRTLYPNSHKPTQAQIITKW